MAVVAFDTWFLGGVAVAIPAFCKGVAAVKTSIAFNTAVSSGIPIKAAAMAEGLNAAAASGGNFWVEVGILAAANTYIPCAGGVGAVVTSSIASKDD